MSIKSQTYLNIEQLADFLRHIITNNRHLQSKGLNPAAVQVVGDSGIGKTSMAMQLASELNLELVKLNLAQIEELGDLVGFPVKQYQMVKDGEQHQGPIWVDEPALHEYTSAGFHFTSNKRMSYCPPEWIADKQKGGILLIDDWTRGDTRFVQACMELIDRQTYISWKLPQDWHIILTANPDNGEYNVNSIDSAQLTRFISVNLKFDVDCWARWAERAGVDGRCINFLHMHPDLVKGEINSRSVTNFFNSISSFDSFESNLPMIQMIGEGSVGQEFASLFVLFINNQLDRLISPKDMLLHRSLDWVHQDLKRSINLGNNYRADIASTLAMRFINYTLHWADENKVEDGQIKRIQDLVTSDIFTIDLRYNIIKGIFNGNRTKFRNLTMEPAVAKYIL
jgi:hypothetical protein